MKKMLLTILCVLSTNVIAEELSEIDKHILNEAVKWGVVIGGLDYCKISLDFIKEPVSAELMRLSDTTTTEGIKEGIGIGLSRGYDVGYKLQEEGKGGYSCTELRKKFEE